MRLLSRLITRTANPASARTRSTKASPLDASRIALVATASMSCVAMPVAAQKWVNTSMVAKARPIGSSPSSPVDTMPSPMRTFS